MNFENNARELPKGDMGFKCCRFRILCFRIHMRNYSLTFVYNIYIKEKIQTHNPKYVRLSNSRRPQGDSADTKCPQAAQRKQAKRAC